ncbi:MAG: hypothetical protein WD649_05840 [Thermoleophilaceae bacterium]
MSSAAQVRTSTGRHLLSRRTARTVGYAGFALALALPLVLWHRVIGAVASDFRLELEYLVTGWTAWGLIALGLLFFVPVVVSIGRRPGSRLYPRSRNAYVGWGVSLYLLGIALASQIAAVTNVHPST